MDEENPAEEQPAPSRPSSLLRYIPMILLVLLLQAAGAYYLVVFYLPGKEKVEDTIAQEVRGKVSEEFPDPPDILPQHDEPEGIIVLDEMRTNPGGTQGDAVVFFKVAVGYAPTDVEDEINKPDIMAKIKDDVLSVMSSHSPEMMDQPDDKRALREEIKVRINGYLKSGKIVEVYFEKFFLQVLEK